MTVFVIPAVSCCPYDRGVRWRERMAAHAQNCKKERNPYDKSGTV
ncbi:MAG: hypothetical protein RLZZ221_2949 [Verrucomicrobiota bacterium]